MVDLRSQILSEIARMTPSASVMIRPMEMRDVDAVSQLERRCYALPWSAGAYATEVRNPSAYYCVAETETGVLLGYGGLWVIMDEAHITTIAVDPDARGHKVGERLFLDLMDGSVERGARRATLEVREHNMVAHNLYKKYGFRDVAIRRHYYSDNGENAIIMWAENLNGRVYQEMLRRYREALAIE